MKRKILLISVALLLLCAMLASCGGDKEIEKLSLTGGLSYKYELNQTPDFSKVTATVTYNDGTTKDLTAADLTFGAVDTTTAGKKQLTISYEGFEITVEIEVEGASVDPSDINEIGHKIRGTELPDWILDSRAQAKQDKFQIHDATYKVGDANPFMLRLDLIILDENLELVTYASKYTSLSTVHLINGTTETLAGSEYVTVDEANNTFDFTAEAVGKTFRISTRPYYGVEEEDEAAFTQTIVVEVVSGYNVTDAKELNLMTNNIDTFLGHTEDQVMMAKTFINNQYGENYYETYGGHYLKGIVLHRNLTPTVNDLPEKYCYTYPTGHPLAGEKAFHNGNFNVYNHMLTSISPSFTLHGNYFQINCRQMPDACDDTVAEYGKSVSNDKLFSFMVDWELFNTEEEFRNYDHSQYTTLIENVSFFGNDASTNNAGENRDHMLALAALNAQFNTTTMRNMAIEAFNNSVIAQNDNLTLNLDKVFFNNAWQGHIYCWINNAIQEDLPGDHDDILTMEGHQPMLLNITNSTLTKCGGPVIMSQIETYEGQVEAYNKGSALHVTVDADTTMWAYANGTEAWFQAFNMTGPASDLMALNAPVAGYGAELEKPSAFTTTNTPEGTLEQPKANLIFLSMSPNDTMTVGGKCVYDGSREAIKQHFTEGFGQYGAPLLESSNGGYATYISGNSLLSPTDGSTDITATGDNCANFFSGDYITAHVAIPNPSDNGSVMRTGVLMEYFH